MNQPHKVHGDQNIIIQNVSDTHVTVEVNGSVQKVENKLEEIIKLLEGESASITINQISYSNDAFTDESFKYVSGGKGHNTVLIKKLVEALDDFGNASVQKIFSRLTAEQKHAWEYNPRISSKVKEKLRESWLGGVLGIMLGKLFAIGSQEYSTEKTDAFLKHSLELAKMTLQILNFALISFLWDKKKEKKLTFNEEEKKVVRDFFEGFVEKNLGEESKLLSDVCQLYKRHKLSFPMEELPPLLEKGTLESIKQNCEDLHVIDRKRAEGDITPLSCYVAEQHLGDLIGSLIFLSTYEMTSVKKVVYEEARDTNHFYLHFLAPIKAASFQRTEKTYETLNFARETICTEAVLMHKDRYQQSINLFPFLIDLNALTFDKGTHIGFFREKDTDNPELHFWFLGSGKRDRISYSGKLKAEMKEEELNELFKEEKEQESLRKQLKADSVYLQFQAARRDLLDEKDTIEDIFSEE